MPNTKVDLAARVEYDDKEFRVIIPMKVIERVKRVLADEISKEVEKRLKGMVPSIFRR